LRIEAPGAGRAPVQYIQEVTFDGAASAHVWLDWDRVREGGTLRFTLGDAPGSWGTAPVDLPPAACEAQSP
jgi:putative alpha-1,2-mannosidase